MQFEFFPSRTVSFYMAKMFFVRILAVLAMLVLVLQALDLLSESGKILENPANGEAQLWTYVSLRAPQIIARFLPFSVLLATIITLATLNQNSEVISLKASGLSAHQILAPLVLTSLLVAAVSFTFNERIVARATATLTAWANAEYGPIPKDPNVRANIWVRDGTNVINAGQVLGRGPAVRLVDITYYRRNPNGSLTEIVRADRGTPEGNAWRLDDATAFDVASGTERRLTSLIVGKDVTVDQFTLSDVDPDALSFTALNDAIDELREAGRRTAAPEAYLWHKISGPLSSILMPLLGAVAAFGLARSGQLFFRAVIGMALGFAYFVADNFALAMGDLGAYPPFLAAWSPFLLFLLIGETVLIRTEE